MPKNKRKILVVDDDSDILDFIKMCLEEDYQVISTISAKKALTIISKEKFDLMIIDLNLSETKGQELIKTIRKTLSTPIIAISGIYSQQEFSSDATELNIKELITKPFSVGKLLKSVEIASAPTTKNTPE